MLELTIKFFVLLNPFGALKVMHALLHHLSAKHRRWIVLRECMFATSLMVATALFGKNLFAHLGIEIPALETAGGCILFLLALSNLFPSTPFANADHTQQTVSPFLIPLAIPMMAGPGMLTNILVAADMSSPLQVCGAICIVSISGLAIWLSAAAIERRIGRNGILVIDRFVGLLLIMIAVNMVLAGIQKQFFH